MKCLTDSETCSWLNDNDVTPAPYGKENLIPEHYVQFQRPRLHWSVEAFIDGVLGVGIAESPALIYFEDWSPYRQSQMLVIESLRTANGDLRNLIDAPGHLFTADEHDLAIAMFSLATSFHWTTYLYLPNDLVTIYNWEGELFDAWSRDISAFNEIAELVNLFELNVTAR